MHSTVGKLRLRRIVVLLIHDEHNGDLAGSLPWSYSQLRFDCMILHDALQ